VTPRIPSPPGPLAELPAEVVAALKPLPEIVEHTEEMRRNTAVLRDVADGMQSVSRETEALPHLRRDMDSVAESTGYIAPMDKRMAAIEEAMPVLVELQQHLAQLPRRWRAWTPGATSRPCSARCSARSGTWTRA
jgi:chemotaxis regulatin CheY-phosphate phosphatase CheZ